MKILAVTLALIAGLLFAPRAVPLHVAQVPGNSDANRSDDWSQEYPDVRST